MSGFNPCPFCGSTDVSRSWQSASVIAIECTDCEATGPARRGDSTQEAKDGARDAWNTRVSPWRSFKDDPPTKGPVLIRRGQRASWRFGAQIAPWLPVSEYFLERGYTEWMEAPL